MNPAVSTPDSSMRVLMYPGFLADTWSSIEERYLWLDKPINDQGACYWLVPKSESHSETINQKPLNRDQPSLYVSRLREIGAHLVERDLSGWNFPRNFLTLARVFREHRIDIVYTHFGPLRFHVEAAAKLLGVEVARGEHNFAFHPDRRFRQLKLWFWRWSTSHFIPVSQAVAAHLRENKVVSNNCTVVHDGFDLEHYPVPSPHRSHERICSELGIPIDKRLLACVAKIHPAKRQHLLIEAMTTIPKNVVLLLVGGVANQDYANELIAQIDRQGLNDRVRFLGYRADIPTIFDAVEISYLPSMVEGLGNVVIESGLMGTPAIATDLPAIREIIDHGQDGYLVADADPVAIAQFTCILLQDESLRRSLGMAAKTKMSLLFSRDAFVNDTISALKQSYSMGSR